MFDFNGDGHTDSGEHYIGYKIFEDVTSGSGSAPGTGRRSKLSGWDIFLIVLIVYSILNTLCR